jgi:hypothetical protein
MVSSRSGQAAKGANVDKRRPGAPRSPKKSSFIHSERKVSNTQGNSRANRREISQFNVYIGRSSI